VERISVDWRGGKESVGSWPRKGSTGIGVVERDRLGGKGIRWDLGGERAGQKGSSDI
jgi:hypothetical protein